MTPRPFTAQDAAALARQVYGLDVQACPLDGEYDHNFLLTAPSRARFVLKIATPETDGTLLDFQKQALQHLRDFEGVPRLLATPAGDLLPELMWNGQHVRLRLLRYLPGTPLAQSPNRHHAKLLFELGTFLARLDEALRDFAHPAMKRTFPWNLAQASEEIERRLCFVRSPSLRRLLEESARRFDDQVRPFLPALPAQVIHNDANDHNVLVQDDRLVGLIDFGDMMYGPRIFEVAVAAAYAGFGHRAPARVVAPLIAGYHAHTPLHADELAFLYDLIRTRLAVSLALAAERAHTHPEYAYYQISARDALQTLRRWARLHPDQVLAQFRAACGLPALPTAAAVHPPRPQKHPPIEDLLARRRRLLGPNLSLTYREPLHIVRGRGQYLFDADGNAYLDCVNNVCHVGHSHPRVVAALAEQAALLNTNTRYLHENILRLAERLVAKLPGRLSVCYFVNSGSEANDLAIRLARAYTGKRDMLVLEGAYHGNLTTLIDISPYKFDGPGGQGAPPWVHKLSMPCSYRGKYRLLPDPVAGYLEEARAVIQRIQAEGRGLAAFIAEPMMGTGGQVVFPPGYLRAMYELVREAGGVCIADEVQVGFGRPGTHFWGFETHGVVPDIVTMGKPMGNGHPLAAVVTTPEIAAAFDNGMEYFNTFGGNPVSCAVGLAVLDIIEEGRLQEHAREVGDYLRQQLLALRERHALIGDVRGSGLFLGIELVRDRETLEPATEEARQVVEAMKRRRILLSTDGPMNNVIKIKPPMVFTRENADLLVEKLDEVLTREIEIV
ncbi:aminotransferase class III-fold pyridoxal phosphate-dependent enzyme [Rhodothermus marinus]|uniref:aminotransferase class III-fold pyridoxal phosphate-dependent enzyme n=1 Tax=Rhodothermus marinus TaxID=29549 RepID=UPI0037C7A410